MTSFNFNRLNEDILHMSALFAGANWEAWRTEYECDGLQALICRPLDSQETEYSSGMDKINTKCKLTKEEIKALKGSRFNRFMNEYSLSRNFVATEKSGLKGIDDGALKTRMRLKGLIIKASIDQTKNFSCVEKLQSYLTDNLSSAQIKSHYSEDSNSRKPIQFTSFCSKLLTFYDPSKFTPYDQFARKGIDALKRNKSQPLSQPPYSCYNSFNKDFNSFTQKQLDNSSDQIDEMIKVSRICTRHKNLAARRILDSYLMIAGGYQGQWLASRALSE